MGAKLFELLGAPENVVFSAAIVLMLLIGVVQLIGLGGDFGADVHADGDLLSWLGVGRLPLMMLLVVFLAVFGVVGLIGQQLLNDWFGLRLSPWIAVPGAAVVALPLTGFAAGGLAQILPHDETTAVPIDVLVGQRAQIIVGRATIGSPARARAEDHHGQAHYVMVEPNSADEQFEEGDTVLLVRLEGDRFRAIGRGDRHVPRLDN